MRRRSGAGSAFAAQARSPAIARAERSTPIAGHRAPSVAGSRSSPAGDADAERAIALREPAARARFRKARIERGRNLTASPRVARFREAAGADEDRVTSTPAKGCSIGCVQGAFHREDSFSKTAARVNEPASFEVGRGIRTRAVPSLRTKGPRLFYLCSRGPRPTRATPAELWAQPTPTPARTPT